MVWIKEKQTYGKLGFYVFGKHEFLMIGVKGSMLPTDEKFTSVLNDSLEDSDASNDIHTKKPHGVYKIIETMYPGRRYIELFARNLRTGWQSWGNEV
jgi:N6-adenosine-specific RNA methylase IME4